MVGHIRVFRPGGDGSDCVICRRIVHEDHMLGPSFRLTE